MTKYFFLAVLISLLSLPITVNATIFAANSGGSDKNLFYTNETIYAYGNESVATGSKSVRVYIVSNSDSWTNGTVLTPIISYSSLTTDSSGKIPLTAIWSPDTVAGSYDLVIDTNNDGIYNQSIDFVDNETSLGFKIIEAPKPTLAFALGESNPSNQNWNYGNNSQSVMIQFKITAGSAEDISINSMDLIAGGTGDDKLGISAIRIYVDANSNGNVDDLDSLVAFGKFTADNGVLNVLIPNNYIIKANSTVRFIATYTMNNNVANGNTFNFQIVSVSALGLSGKKAVVTGLPLTSSTKTIVGAPQQSQPVQTISCTDFKNKSSCAGTTCNWCDSDDSCKNTSEICPKICRGNLSLSIQQGDSTSTAVISGLADCDNNIVFIKEGSCNNATIASCNATGSGCSISFQNLPVGEHMLYACLDVNENKVFESSEQASQIILVQQSSQQKTETESPKPSLESNYPIILVAIIVIGVAIYFLVFRKKPDKYEKLKEKWRR